MIIAKNLNSSNKYTEIYLKYLKSLLLQGSKKYFVIFPNGYLCYFLSFIIIYTMINFLLEIIFQDYFPIILMGLICPFYKEIIGYYPKIINLSLKPSFQEVNIRQK